MSEIRIKAGPWPSAKPFTATVTAEPAPRRGVNPMQDSLMRLDESEQLRQQGKLERAQKICESLVREHPDYMAAQHTLGLIHADRKNYDRAFDHLSRAAMLNPRSWMTLTALAGVCLELHAGDMAARVLEQARAIKPRDANVLVTLGELYRAEREYELAKEAFREAVTLEDRLLPAVMGLGRVCAELGQNAEAAEVFEGLINRGMSDVAVLFALTGVPSPFIKVDLLAELDKLSRHQSEGGQDEQHAALVRAAALDGAGRHAEAWQHLVPVNRAIFIGMQEDFRDLSERQNTIFATLQRNPIKPMGDSRDRGPISLFILGPSRSGKTTMEQLVATLTGVKRGYENPGIDRAIRRTFQSAGLLTRSYFEMLPPQLYSQCRDIYLEELAERAASARVFTNTNPPRIFDAHLMASALPNVRFIFMKRNLEDNVLRMYQRKYQRGNSYSYDLKAARDYVAWYHKMIDLMAEKAPGIVRIIHYEDMVTDPPGALRVAADLCGLPMNEGPLPQVGDDRGCAAPYKQFMAAAQ